MKKLHFIIAAVTMLFFNACKKSEDTVTPPAAYKCVTCKTTPDALAANNSSSKGVYKGVMIGSTGTIMFDIANNGNTITAVLIIDGITVNLTSAVTWVSGQSYTAPFTGTLNGTTVTINFSVGLSGGTPTVTSSNIPGHPNASLNIIKETSSNLLECFEGTYSTTLPETGIFNLMLSRSLNTWTAVSRKTGSTTSNVGNGIITDNNLIDPSQNNRVIGVLNMDGLNGNFVDANGKTVTVTGKRTL